MKLARTMARGIAGALVALLASVLVSCGLDTSGASTAILHETDSAAAELPDAASEAAPREASADAVSSVAPDAPIADGSADAKTSDAPDPCDQDGDGHKVLGATCGGDDCCDFDARVKPGQTQFFATPSACGSFDYDCDKLETMEHGVADCKLGWFECTGDGFHQTTACGVSSDYTTCAYTGFSCNKNDDSRVQRCR